MQALLYTASITMHQIARAKRRSAGKGMCKQNQNRKGSFTVFNSRSQLNVDKPDLIKLWCNSNLASLISCLLDVETNPLSAEPSSCSSPLGNNKAMGRGSMGLPRRTVPLCLSHTRRDMHLVLPAATQATVSNKHTLKPSPNKQDSSHRCHMSAASLGRCSSRHNSSRASTCLSRLCLHNRILGSTTAYLPVATSQHSSSLQLCPRYVDCLSPCTHYTLWQLLS